MITLTTSCILLGFFALYSTSALAQLTLKYQFQIWLKNNRKTGTYLGVSILFISFFCALYTWGIGAGILSFLVVLMTVASLVILIAPLRFIKLYVLIGMIVMSFGIELFLR